MNSQLTCWTVIVAAAQGGDAEREQFAKIYLPVVRGFLAQRWRYGPLPGMVDDAVQEVFVECLKEKGSLAKADRDRGDFRGYLFGLVRNVARRFEERRKRELTKNRLDTQVLAELSSDEASQSRMFERSWAAGMMQQAAQLQLERASEKGDEARLRCELLQERFRAGLPIREIATKWNHDATYLHRQYAKARDEFRDALMQVVSFHAPGASPEEIDQECRQLLGALQK